MVGRLKKKNVLRKYISVSNAGVVLPIVTSRFANTVKAVHVATPMTKSISLSIVGFILNTM